MSTGVSLVPAEAEGQSNPPWQLLLMAEKLQQRHDLSCFLVELFLFPFQDRLLVPFGLYYLLSSRLDHAIDRIGSAHEAEAFSGWITAPSLHFFWIWGCSICIVMFGIAQ